jgi:hypothetical protein
MYTQITFELSDGTSGIVHQTSEKRSSPTFQDLVGQRIYIGWNSQDGQILLK